MPKYSFRSIRDKEKINSTNASTFEEAVIIFSKRKDLTLANFLNLYEVIEE